MPTTCSPDEAAALLWTTDLVGFGLGPAIPPRFLTALGRRTDWEHLVLGGNLLLGLYDVLTHPKVEWRTGFFGPVERAYFDLGHHISLVPAGLRQMGPILARMAPRVMAVHGRIDEARGVVNLSLHVGGSRDALMAAGADPNRLLIVEDNPLLPMTSSITPYENTIPLELVDVVVAGGDPLFELPEDAPDDVARQIAEIAASLVVDGATLQTGIGSIPTMVAAHLASGPKGNFGVHSEMFTDGLRRLHQAGKVTNANKGQLDGVSVTTFALGTAELYAFLDQNPEVAFCPVELVNDPTVIARNRAFTSINGAISVDLYGQIVCEAVDGHQVSGVGGHEDFVAGAEIGLDDISLVCLPSTATVKGELRSRLVLHHPAGAIVSTPRHHTGVVVTEFGAADLRGRTIAERARALAAIAHPEFRTELERAARTFGRPPTAVGW